MSSPASAIDPHNAAANLAELIAASSIEISPRELHKAPEVAALLPATTCVYVPSLPGLPLSRTLEVLGAIRAAGLDPVPHVSARRVPGRDELRDFLKRATHEFGVHRVMLIGGDERAPRGPYRDSLEILEEGVLAASGVKEIGVAGYPEGHPAIPAREIGAAFEKKLKLAREQGLGLYVVTQFSFSPARMIEFAADLERGAPGVPLYAGIAGPTDPAALARYAQRCGVSASLRALRTLGTGIAKLVTHTDPSEAVHAMARYTASRESSSVVGLHFYSFGGAVRTAEWMRGLL